jgi:hypothetical protein
MTPWTAYHGISRSDLAKLSWFTFEGSDKRPEGIHVGSLPQARMRSGRGAILEVQVHTGRFEKAVISRVKYRPGNWKKTVQSGVRKGLSALVYLNRWEGMPGERLEEILTNYSSDRFDRMSDAQVRKVAPEMEDSWVILDPDVLSIERVLVRSHEDMECLPENLKAIAEVEQENTPPAPAL